MKIEEFEFLDESDKAWHIEKSFFPHNGDPEHRWIPKSVSRMNEEKTVIEIDDWFYNVWINELEKERKNFEEIQVVKKNQDEYRETLKETELFNETVNFVKTKISDLGSSEGFSNTRTVFYLGEYAKYMFSEKKDKNVLIFNHRLKELLKSNEFYKEAYDFIQSQRVPVQMPKEKELTFVMTEFMELLIAKKASL